MIAPLPWHRADRDRLMAARAGGRLAHGLLLFGPAGMGKAHFADLLARSLLCERPVDGDLPCGTCGACVLLDAGNHPDFRRCGPEEGAGGDRGRGTIGVDPIRTLTDFMSLRAHQGGWKVALIDQADRMNPNASNALLKTLEEPPEKSLLILCTAHPARLPATVLSRCQRIRFAPGDDTVALDWLAERLEGDRDHAALLLGLAGGAPLAALDIARTGGAERRAGLLDDFEALALGRADPLRIAESWLRFGVRESLHWVYLWLADMVRLKVSGATSERGDAHEKARLQGIGAHTSMRRLLAAQDRVVQALRAGEGQVNHQLLLEEVVIAIAGLPGARPPGRRP